MKKIIAIIAALVITLSVTFSQLNYQSIEVKIDKTINMDTNLLPPRPF
jgi:uncharacterized membrane protein